MTLHGIDVSGWQPENITTIVQDYDFAIIKASGATNYTSAKAPKQAQGALDSGKRIGFYHFALEKEADKGPEAEAEHFLKAVKPFLQHKPLLVLDFEGQAAEKLPFEWAVKWLNYVYKHSGIRPLFYTFESVATRAGTKLIKDAGYPLWVASFGNGSRTSYAAAPKPPATTWGASPTIFQFTETGRLKGYDANIDLNVFYGQLSDWDKLVGKTSTTPTPAPKPPVTTPPKRKTGQQLAQEVLDGKWGNGNDRIQNLRKEGYNAEAVQNEVNLVLTRRNVTKLAREVIDRKWGDGEDRVKRLKAAGWDPQTVQNEVNRLLNTAPVKSVAQLADEVIAGKWGVDPDRTRKLKAAGHNATAVQAEVNRKLKR